MPHRVRASISSRSSALPHHRGYYPEGCVSTVWKGHWSWHSRRQLTFPRFEMVLSEQPFPRCRCSYPKKENCDQSFPCPSHWLLSSRSGKLLLRKKKQSRMSVVALLMVKTLAGRSLCVLTCVAKKTSSKPLIAMRQTSANIPEDRVPVQGRNRRDRGVRSNGFMAGMNRWHKKVDWRIIQRFRRRWPIWYYKGTSINGQQSTMQITTKATESFQNVVIVF